MKRRWAAATLGLLSILAGCGGGSASPNAPTTPSPAPTASAIPAPPPTAAATVEAACRSIGFGKAGSSCRKLEDATVLPLVMTAANLLVVARPEIFDTNIEIGSGSYRVLDEKAYLEGMQVMLASLGVCSQADHTGSNLRVKSHNDLDETYEVLNAKGHIGRGFRTYLQSCTPAGFPLTPGDAFSHVRTAFFGYKCDAGVQKPVPASGQLPVVCSGIVTATPKDANGVNTPPEIHGTDVSWRLRSGDEVVSAYPVLDGNIFNYVVQAKAVGSFSLCATVGGQEGCLNGKVTPYP